MMDSYYVGQTGEIRAQKIIVKYRPAPFTTDLRNCKLTPEKFGDRLDPEALKSSTITHRYTVDGHLRDQMNDKLGFLLHDVSTLILLVKKLARTAPLLAMKCALISALLPRS